MTRACLRFPRAVDLSPFLEGCFFFSPFLSSSVLMMVMDLALSDLREGAGAEGTRDLAILRGSSVLPGGLADR